MFFGFSFLKKPPVADQLLPVVTMDQYPQAHSINEFQNSKKDCYYMYSQSFSIDYVRSFLSIDGVTENSCKIKIPNLIMAKFHGACISGKCGVITAQHELPCSSFFHENNNKIHGIRRSFRSMNFYYEEPQLYLNTYDSIKFKKGRFFLIATTDDHAFSHFLYDTMTKIFICKSLVSKNDYFVFSEDLKSYQLQLLIDIGISPSQIVIKPFKELWHCEVLYIIHSPAKNNGWVLPLALNELHHNFYKAFLGINFKKSDKYDKIYIDRNDERQNMRSIINEAEIKKFVKQRGYYIITPGKLDFKQKVQLFYQANSIIGQYGGGLQLAFLTNGFSKIMTLQSPHFDRQQIDYYQAFHPLKNYNLIGESISTELRPARNSSFKICLDTFQEALELFDTEL